MAEHIRGGDTERIEAVMLDGSLNELTGLTGTVLLSIRRVSNGHWYDFNDDTFKASGWTTRQQAMIETDLTNDPGQYHYDFDTSAITNAVVDDTYMVRVDQAVAANVPLFGSLKVDQWVEDLFDEHASTQSDVASVQTDTDNIQTRLPAALVSGRMDSSVGAMAAGVVTAAAVATDAVDADALAADAVAEIQLGLATSAALAAVQVDTDDIQTRLPAALVGGRMDSDVGNLQASVVTAAAVATDAIDADALAADAVVEIQLGLATAAGLTAVEANLLAQHTVTQVAIAALNDLGVTDVQTALTNQGYTATRALLLDNLTNLDATITSVLTAISALNDISTADVQTAMTNQGYTGARAVLLDNLDVAISTVNAAVAALNDLSVADVQTAMTNQGYTAARGPLLDNLDALISSRAVVGDLMNLTVTALTAINTQLEVTSGHGAGSWQSDSGLTQQQVRDSMKLAPTGGAPIAGSVDQHLDDIDGRLPSDPADESLQQAAHAQTQADIVALNDLDVVDIQTAMTNQGYTAARAANLDFLDAAISTVIANISALNNISQADVQAAMDSQGYSVARAALLDNLDAAISSVLASVAALNNVSIADVQTAMTNQGYTSGRAPNLDFLDTAVSGIAAAVAALNDLDATQVENTVWDAMASGHIAGGTMGLLLNDAGGAAGVTDWTNVEKNQIRFRLAMDGAQVDPTTGAGTLEDLLVSTSDIQSRVPAVLVGGRMDSHVGSMATDVIDADVLAADAVVKIQSGLATSVDLARVLGLLHENTFIDNMTFDGAKQQLTARYRTFSSKADADAATKGGTGEGEVALYQSTATYSAPGLLDTFRETLEP